MKKHKKLVLIRHGEALPTQSGLSDLGKAQMEKAADYIKEYFKNVVPHLFSSEGPCAREGAKIIRLKIGCTPVIMRGLEVADAALDSFDNYPDDVPRVVITRGKFIQSFAEKLAEKIHCPNPFSDKEKQDKGQAYAIVCDLENKTMEKITF